MEQLSGILPLVLIFVVFYFLLIRPQQKKLKSHKEMITNLKKGDKIVTQGGIMGTIHYVNEDGTISLEVADNVTVKVAKGMVADVSK
ncbi:preprotein translocase subunit YajC [Alphaproteobacteria bacterium]|jgi:preprotein translocase subunit YajC|nr:preprotein translocase subunit YajC [Alphaproteobacteria bacterium]MDB4234416.1 preprotein translocase subunit YajC [Alphaproteobacteria bacterium]MDB9824900.1 preprotein translocase subunit YajC [Alphaproteobacteria bacterium]|tara:strand:- start:1082 stop:1342 length:261 start_codon:yes stop_codon:yes gene_type:complete